MDQKAYFKEYALKNHEKLAAYKYAWRKKKRENPEYVAKENQAQKERRAKKVYVEQLVKAAIRASLYRKNNPARVNANKAKRKAAKILRTPKWLTPIDFERINTQYQLASILTKLHNEQWHVDHIIPLQGTTVSGLHVPANLQVVRWKENLTKSNKFEVR